MLKNEKNPELSLDMETATKILGNVLWKMLLKLKI